jgi:hypothetical protein
VERKRLAWLAGVLATAFVGFAAISQPASALSCNAIRLTSIDGVSLDPVRDASDCAGLFTGNDVGKKGTLVPNLDDGSLFDMPGDYSIFGQSDKLGSVVAENGATMGDWTVDFGMDVTKFVLTLKSSNRYAAFLFENVSGSVFSGTFSTGLAMLLNKNNRPQKLSHLTAVVLEKGTTVVPLPATLPLFFAALGGIGLLSRRRRSA